MVVVCANPRPDRLGERYSLVFCPEMSGISGGPDAMREWPLLLPKLAADNNGSVHRTEQLKLPNADATAHSDTDHGGNYGGGHQTPEYQPLAERRGEGAHVFKEDEQVAWWDREECGCPDQGDSHARGWREVNGLVSRTVW